MKWESRDAPGVDEVMEGEREIVSSQILRRVWRSSIFVHVMLRSIPMGIADIRTIGGAELGISLGA